MAGATLGEATHTLGERLLGARAIEVFGMRFPLLAKFIDAHQWLSVQAHPDDGYAADWEDGKLGKTESWYILDAEPGAQIIYGVKRPVNREEVRAAIEANALEALLRSAEVSAGDVVFVPAGTIHAIGSGVALYELQEYSDITYRLYDYGRLQANGQPRELHIDRGLDVMRCEPSRIVKATPLVGEQTASSVRRTLVACKYFVEDEYTFSGQVSSHVTPSSLHVVTVIEGSCAVRWPGGELSLALGDTAVLPAGMGAYIFEGRGRVIRAYVPDADDPTLEAWRKLQGSDDVSR